MSASMDWSRASAGLPYGFILLLFKSCMIWGIKFSVHFYNMEIDFSIFTCYRKLASGRGANFDQDVFSTNSLPRKKHRHAYIHWMGPATSRGFIVYVTSELLCIGELSMASDAFTLDTLFLLHRGANFINWNSNSFAIKFAHRLYVAPFFAWVVLGRFHVLTRGAAMKWWLALEACLKGGGKHSTMWMYQNCLEIAQRRSK